ncbi:MAG: leucine-rich repeat protein [Clostridia bacterium]|nr:leucine-rich repeat protein [Clostridia bacterium]
MPITNSYYKQKLAEIDKKADAMYGGSSSYISQEFDEYTKLKELQAHLLDGAALHFSQNFIKLDKGAAREIKRKRHYFKKKNFYFTLTPEGKAVIFAARVKDEREPLVIPEKLGKYTVGGICELKLSQRYPARMLRDELKISPVKRADRGGNVVLGVLSFTSLSGHEGLEETVLRDEGREITVAPTVKILNCALLPNAQTLRLPSTLTYLGYLFAPQLKKIEIYDCGEPSEICRINVRALSLCEKLADLALPTGTKNVYLSLLSYNCALQRLYIPKGVEDIPLVSGERKLKELHVLTDACPNAVPNLRAENAVINGNIIHRIEGEIDHLTLVGDSDELKQIQVKICDLTMSDSIETIKASALSGQEKLSRITLPSSLKSIGAYAFKKSGLTEIDIPDTVGYIGTLAFEGCERLKRVHLPSSLQTLQTDIFKDCTSLHELALPDGLTEIKPKLVSTKEQCYAGKKDGRSVFIILDNLRLLGVKDAIDPLLRMHITYNENTPAAAAMAAYRKKMRENIQMNIEVIEKDLGPIDKLTVTSENIDHVTAAIFYIAAVMPVGTPILLSLTSALAAFFKEATQKTDSEADFLYCNYFFDTIKSLKSYGQKQAFDILESCRADLSSRITASLKHAMKGEKLLSKNTPKAREEALPELVRAYHIYPRNAPTVIALIHWFASDPLLYDSLAISKLLKILEECSHDTEGSIDYEEKARELIKTVKSPRDTVYHGFLSRQEKRDLYFADFNASVGRAFTKMPAPTPTDENRCRENMKKPRRLSILIDEKFFAEIREEINSRLVSSFGGTVEFGEQCRQEKLDAVDAAEATIFPEKRKALEERLKKRREAEEKKRREEAEKLRRAQSVYSASTSISYDDDRYGYGKGYDSSTSLFPNTFYSYSYNNPYSPVTELEDWARAEVIGIEWDIIDRDYYLDLGIFGDHVL